VTPVGYISFHLVMAAKAVASTGSVFMSLLAGDCLTTHETLDLSCLYRLGTYHIENTSPSSSSVVASCGYCSDCRDNTILCYCLWPLPSSGRCLQSHYVAVGLYATVLCLIPYLLLQRNCSESINYQLCWFQRTGNTESSL
jgi:hypothetical protein